MLDLTPAENVRHKFSGVISTMIMQKMNVKGTDCCGGFQNMPLVDVNIR